MNDKNDIEYGPGESIENDDDDEDDDENHVDLNLDDDDDDDDGDDDDDNDLDDNNDDGFMDRIPSIKRSKLPNFYEFTFDVKNTIRKNTTKLSNIDRNPALYPFLEEYKPVDINNEIMDESHSTITLWDDCCEYAQQISEIARVWFQKSSDTTNIDEITTDQTTFTIYPKYNDLTKFTMDTIELDNRRQPLSSPINGTPSTIDVLPEGFLTHLPSSTVSVHRRLPPLPVDSLSAAIITTATTDTTAITTTTITTTTSAASLAGHYTQTISPMSADFFSPPTTIISHPVQPIAKEDHRICFGTDSVMGNSVLLFEDSYYEDSNLNDSQLPSRKALSQFGQEDSSGVSSCCTTGINLRTNQHGIFPSAHVCEIDLVEEICMGALPSNVNQTMTSERDTFYLTMLASIEVAHHKGNDILVQAMNKVLNVYQNKEEVIVPQTVLMEVSYRGIHIIDKRRKNFFQCPTFDFFYSLQNISFCGAHPKQLRYFGFITKHPLLPRFACHVFLSNVSTQPIVESIGRAFKRSYDEYMAFAHPTEDIYLE
ncbi:hypothetical protein LOAG_18610 [Loa loa]|uniref:PID domain-containing protein n=1 Tax=Loa loa TaxID=7209 RepID=A0A1S0UF71_LOALO|nr:hypothetical protein LOAG_18610 [Loa loa]EJD74018.1 hypothetical protein LOAG_18610 [Loa loa]